MELKDCILETLSQQKHLHFLEHDKSQQSCNNNKKNKAYHNKLHDKKN